MGAFYVDCVVESIEKPAKQLRVEKLLVDTGSEYTWLPEEDLKQLSISPRKKDVPFIMANGEIITREVGYAILYVDTFETIDEVVFGRPGDLSLLGARTLEGFGAAVDSRQKKIVAAGPIPAALAVASPDVAATASPGEAGSAHSRAFRTCREVKDYQWIKT